MRYLIFVLVLLSMRALGDPVVIVSEKPGSYRPSREGDTVVLNGGLSRPDYVHIREGAVALSSSDDRSLNVSVADVTYLLPADARGTVYDVVAQAGRVTVDPGSGSLMFLGQAILVPGARVYAQVGASARLVAISPGVWLVLPSRGRWDTTQTMHIPSVATYLVVGWPTGSNTLEAVTSVLASGDKTVYPSSGILTAHGGSTAYTVAIYYTASLYGMWGAVPTEADAAAWYANHKLQVQDRLKGLPASCFHVESDDWKVALQARGLILDEDGQ